MSGRARMFNALLMIGGWLVDSSSIMADLWVNVDFEVSTNPGFGADTRDFGWTIEAERMGVNATVIGQTIDGVSPAGNIASDPQFQELVDFRDITFGPPDRFEMTWRRLSPTIDWDRTSGSSTQGQLHFGARLVGDIWTAEIKDAEWSTETVSESAKARSKLKFTRTNSFGFSYTNLEDEEVEVSDLVFESHDFPLPLENLYRSADLDGTPLDPIEILIDNTSVPGDDSFTVESGSELRFVFSGESPPYMTVQGVGTFANGTVFGFALQDSQIIPEPITTTLLCLVGVAKFVTLSVNRLRPGKGEMAAV